MRSLLASLILTTALLTGCGGGAAPVRPVPVRQVLAGTPEQVELESVERRQDLFREIARASVSEAGNAANPLVLFPVSVDGSLVAAPGFDGRTDLLQAPDAGTVLFRFEDTGDRWSEDRRDSLQGLSEREVAELVARSLVSQWGLLGSSGGAGSSNSASEIAVDRASGAPYAVAYVDGLLRINPSFLYLAASISASSSASASTPGAGQ